LYNLIVCNLIDKNFNKLFYQKYNVYPNLIFQGLSNISIEANSRNNFKYHNKTLSCDRIKNDFEKNRFIFTDKLLKLQNSEPEDNKEMLFK